MARIIQKVEGESFYIIYCNTSGVLMPNMFESEEAAQFWLDSVFILHCRGNSEPYNRLVSFQGELDKDVIVEALRGKK